VKREVKSNRFNVHVTIPTKETKKVENKIRPDEKFKKYNNEKIKFYQQFAKNDFEDISDTSSEPEESSSDDFPSPSPNRNKHRKEDYSHLSKKVMKR